MGGKYAGGAPDRLWGMVRDKRFYRTFFKMTFFLSAQNLIILFVGLVDNVMLGSYSEAALSGAALANQIQFILQCVALAIGMGVALFASQYWGKQRALGQSDTGTAEMQAARDAGNIGILLAAATALVFFLAVTLVPGPCLRLFTTDESIIAEGLRYLSIIRFSYLFFALSNVFFAILRSVEVVHIGTVSSIVSLAVNVTLNYVLIFGHWGAPRMGIAGAAVATCIARFCEFGIALGYLWFRDKRVAFLHYRFHFNAQMLRDLAKATAPIMLSNGLWGVSMALHTGILGHLGREAIAASSISNSMFQMINVFVEGCASATAVIVANAVGGGQLRDIKKQVRTMQVLFVLLGVAGALILFAMAKPILLLYPQVDPRSLELAWQFTLVSCVTFIGTAYQVPCNCGIVRGGGDTRFVLYMDLVLCWLYVAPVGLLAAFVWKLPTVWVYFLLRSDQLLKCFVAFVKTNRYRWIHVLIRE